jgi:hypothetical protein
MKNYIYLLLLVTGTIMFLSACDDSLPEVDSRLQNEEITFQHIDPASGETETNVFEGVYGNEDVVKLSFTTKLTVEKVLVLSSATGALLEEQTINGTSASFEYLVSDLNIPFGLSTELTFYLYYDDQGTNGFDYPSMKMISYKVISDIPAVTRFYYNTGSVEDIIIRENYGGAYSKDENGNVVFSFEENDKDPLYAVYPDLNALKFGTGDFSFSFWLNTTTDFSDPALFATMDWSSSSNHGWILAWGGYDLRFVMTDADGNKTDVSWAEGTLPVYGVWHHIAVSVDRDGKVVIFIDGQAELDGTASTPGSLDNGSPIHINQDATGSYGDHFHGSYRDIRFFNYPLSAQDVTTIYNATK